MFSRRKFLRASLFGMSVGQLHTPALSNEKFNPTPAGRRLKTPYDFGARGGAILTNCSIERGARTLPGITPQDAGKTVMIAGGALDARSLVARVLGDGTLSKQPIRDLTNAPCHIGWDDTGPLQRFLKAGGGLIPDDIFLCQKPPLRYSDNCTLRWIGTILIGDGWPSSFSLMGDSYGWTGEERRIKNIVFQGEGDKDSLLLSPAGIDMLPGRKGIGITCTDNFELSGLRIRGGVGSLFALQIHYSTEGILTDCDVSVDSMQYHKGSDGIHFIGNCSDVRVVRLRTWTADDSSSQTSEITQSKNTAIRRITYEDCVLENYGHSSIKGLITPQAEASIIEDIEYRNCRFVTHLADRGNGVPIIITNDAKSRGAVIRRISISGGEMTVDDSWTKQIAAPAIMLTGVDEFVMKDLDIEHCGRTLMVANDCKDLTISNVKATPKKKLQRPDDAKKRTPLIKLSNCSNPSVETEHLAPAYHDQRILDIEPPA